MNVLRNQMKHLFKYTKFYPTICRSCSVIPTQMEVQENIQIKNQKNLPLSEKGGIQTNIRENIQTDIQLEDKENIPSISTCETEYLDAIRRIIYQGKLRSNRTGTDTLSIFGMQMRYDIRNSFPLFTTKRVFWRGIVEEMLWFIQACTNSNKLADKNVHIWDANGSRQFLDNLGFTERETGDLGPVYGFQWRHFGAEYQDMNSDYTSKGVDQLQRVIDLIKNDPDNRRIIMSAWNPCDLPKMALPPCHVMCQFFVQDGELSCQMYQRSADMGLGVPFNVASYSLLVYMIAHITGLKPGDFIHTLGDAHVYVNHVEPLKEQLKRSPRPLPTLNIKRSVSDIDDFKVDDFEIIGYKPYGKIKMDMAV
ncbi:thymidylate synthase-like [Argonauta hians]